jgi:putative flavoprotein involved in K+ transport
MTTEHIETAIIGAGQAGLATAYHLQQRGRPCLILDANSHVGDNWRAQWDSLRLYSPARSDGLPGMPFPAPRWSYPTKDQVADYLASYAQRFALPVRTHAHVDRLQATDGKYVLWLGADRIVAENVVVATGTFGRTPSIPDFALDLDPSIRQLHSCEYRSPEQLKPGPVLVVGASHSGTDVAFEVAPTHPTILAGRDPGQMPVRLDHWSVRVVFPIFLFLGQHVITRRTPIGRKAMPEIRSHGAPMLRVKRADLRARGVERVLARVTGVQDGRPVLDDGRVLNDVTNVVWCTGFRQVFDWIDLPIFGADGWPREFRGAVPEAPGLFFCGLAFQYAFSSTVLAGVGRDAAYVAQQIDARSENVRSRRPSHAARNL